MDETNNDEWEEEEIYVLAEIAGVMDSEVMSLKDKTCKVLGMETDQPILQIDKFFFTGEHQDCLGSAVIFEEKGDKLELVCTTTKSLCFKRAFLEEKNSVQCEQELDTTQGKEGNDSKTNPSS